MGCWSESCAISGLEIGDGCESLVMVLSPAEDRKYPEHGTFSRYIALTPPVWGKYTDYGDIDTDETDCDPKFFTEWLERERRGLDPDEDSHMSYMAMFWWVRKDVWDYCDNIPHEFSYGDNPNTIGESIALRREKLIEYVATERRHMEEDANSSEDDTDNEKLIEKLIRRMSARDDDVLGFRSYSLPIISQLKEQLDNAINENDQETIDGVIEAICRLNKLNLVCYELRKICTPSTMNGPQHGGYEAILALNKFTMTTCQEYFAKCGEED